jgi:flagellar hook-basal body complex protein FliE
VASIESVRALSRPADLPSAVPPAPTAATGDGFGEALGRALADVNATQLRGEAAALALAEGRTVDTAAALVTIEKANLTFQFALQIRNKLLEAYQELMRLPV